LLAEADNTSFDIAQFVATLVVEKMEQKLFQSKTDLSTHFFTKNT
jgi:hypothetical protein